MIKKCFSFYVQELLLINYNIFINQRGENKSVQNFYKFVEWINNLSVSQRKAISKDCCYFYNTLIAILAVLMFIFIILEWIETSLRKKQRKDFLDVRESEYLLSSMSEKASILKRYIRHYKRLNKIYDLEILSRILSIIVLVSGLLTGIVMIIPIIGSLFIFFKKPIFFKFVMLCVWGLVYIFCFMLLKGIFYKADYKKDVSDINRKTEMNLSFIEKMKSELKKLK